MLIGIYCLMACSNCNKNNEEEPQNILEIKSTFSIKVPEPSGLAVNSQGTVLYTVSDETGLIYKLSTNGELIQTYNAQGDDLEGITFSEPDKLYLAQERTKEIITFNITTINISKHLINYSNNDSNSGIEGIAYNTKDGTFFILNEKNPGLLIRLRSDFSILSQHKLDFALDYSGIFYDEQLNALWIVSDESRLVCKCTLNGDLVVSYKTNIPKIEGIAVTNSEIYLVSDSESKLYVLNKPN